MFDEIIQVFEANRNPEVAVGMKAYLRDQFETFGIKSPLRREISKPFMKEVKSLSKEEVISTVKRLWDRPEREIDYTAMELFEKVAKKYLNEKEDIQFLEYLILHDSWWDTIDFIAPKLLKIYFEKFPDERDMKVDEWIASGNIWLQRSALLLHLKQKDKVDLEYMFQTILRLNDTREFFVDKAIGWLLREYSKKRKVEIKAFIDQNQDKLSNLSIKEGSKYL